MEPNEQKSAPERLLRMEPIAILACPHCGKSTRAILARRENGPSFLSIFLFGVFALLIDPPRTAVLCEHCKTMFEPVSRSVSLGRIFWFLILGLFLVASIVIIWFQ